MKLKFDKEVEDIINAIAALPDTATEKADIDKAFVGIHSFDRSLIERKAPKAMSVKEWARLRRQLSFMFELLFTAVNAGKTATGLEIHDVENELSKQETYRFLVKAIKGIASGKALEEPSFVRIAMGYGVVRLSDHEIKLLIDNNKI